MTETDFQIQNSGAKIVQADKIHTIYELENKTVKPHRMEYFYFQNGTLVEMNLGKPKPTIVIDKTTHNE
jgi:hypothetical protein